MSLVHKANQIQHHSVLHDFESLNRPIATKAKYDQPLENPSLDARSSVP